MKRTNAVLIAGGILASAALARAQPVPPDPYDPANGSGDGSGQPAGNNPGDKPPPTDGSGAVPPNPNENPFPQNTTIEKPTDTYNPNAPKEKLPDHPVDGPVVITTPTGWILPAAVLWSKTALDTGGGVTSDNRVGLGDVAEFGVATTDAVRQRVDLASRSERIQPYVTASFRLGVQENRLFDHQPGLALGFRKSFERNHDDHKTRIAELTFVASKHIGSRVAIHAGGAFWDASLQNTTGDDRTEITLHDGAGGMKDLKKQIRGFGGISVEPIPKSIILVDFGYAPEFCYECTGDKIRLRPELSWGVRYQVADWMQLESGVRVPDIGSANLLDAQIFGGITFTSWGIRHAVDSIK